MMDTMSMMSLGQKSKFLMLGPCSSSGSSSLFWIKKIKILVWPQRRDVVFRGVDVCGRLSHRLCGLVLSVVQLVAVVEDVVKGRVETGFDTVPHHLTGPGWRLQFLDLTTRWRRSTSEKCCHLWFPKTIQKHMIKKFHSNLHPEEGDAG